MDKSGQGEYLTMISRHLLLSCNPFWRSDDFLDTIGPSRSVCIGYTECIKNDRAYQMVILPRWPSHSKYLWPDYDHVWYLA